MRLTSCSLGAALLSAVGLLGVQGCADVAQDGRGVSGEGARPRVRPELAPEGPTIVNIQTAAENATVTPGGGPGEFRVEFAAGPGKPAATFALDKTDINERHGMALDVTNPGAQPVRAYADLNADTWVRGYVVVPPGTTRTLYVFARRKAHSAETLARFPNMHGIPGGKMSLWAGMEEPIRAEQLKLFLVAPGAPTALHVGNIRPFGSSAVPDRADLFPFIDRYGQYKHKDWPGKTHADADLHRQRVVEDADLARHPGPKGLNQYGGWADGPQLKATGHFRTEKVDGKWWLVDPEGRLFWSNGLDCVTYTQSLTRPAGRERFYEDVPAAPHEGNFLTRNLETKYGPDWRNVASDRLLRRMKSWGINSFGATGDPAIFGRKKVPYTVNFSSRVRGVNPASETFAANVRTALTRAAELYKDDPWFIGFFVDNEIHESNDPAWWETYYRTVGAVAKELLPNKLYLGSRLDYHNWPDVVPARHEIVRIAAKYTDVVSFNFYKFTLDDVVLPEGVDKPIIIGEFHMGALDRGPFHTGLRSVVDQEQRAEAYRLYVASALRNPVIVGAHWFQCFDESTTGRNDGENYQIGFLDICDTPYPETIDAARDVGYRLYDLRRQR